MDRRSFLGAAAAATVAGATRQAGAAGDAGKAPAGRSRAWQIGPRGDFDTMRLVERRVPAPGPGQVLVEVTHTGLAARDIGIVQGWFLEDKPPELVPVSEGVGRVVAVGPGVTRIAVGQRVISTHFAGWVDGRWDPANYAIDVGNTVDGWLAEHALLPETGLVVLPEAISDATAATMAGSGITAWHGLNEVARCRPGDTVLTLGTGGVSTWGLLLAKAAGARVAITSSSDAKLARSRELGADVTINYRTTPNWGPAVFDATGGVDIVLENVGRETLDQSMLACGNNATIVMIGTAALPEQLPKMPGFYIKNLMMKAISNGSRRMLEDFASAVAANGLEAQVARVFDFEEVPDAFRYMRDTSHFGKVLVRHPAAPG